MLRAPEVEDTLARSQTAKRPRVGDAGERLGSGRGHVRQLVRVAKVFGPRAPGREDEVALRVFGHGGIGLLDLALQEMDIDLDVNCHHGLLRYRIGSSGDGGG
jgi:hypothetical protein